jgi:hypothetical protein
MKMCNLASLDPGFVISGRAGLNGGVTKLDRLVFEEFRHDWGELSVQAETLVGLNLFEGDPVNGAKRISSLTEHRKVSRERHFFRSAVLAAYEYRCCISGQMLPNMLVASHIKPYTACKGSNDRTNPENGLCLNVFYDKAFDRGLITVDTRLTIWVSPRVREFPDAFTERWLIDLQGGGISLPARFRPQREFLEYHNEKIFKR